MKSKRILSFVLACCILFTAFSTGTFTEEVALKSEAATDSYNVFAQGDPTWGEYSPGTDGTQVGPNGCGIVSTVNAVYHLTGNFMDIKTLVDWAFANNYYYNGGTWRWQLYPNLQARFGAEYGFKVDRGWKESGATDSELINHLAAGGVAVAHVQSHFICLAGYDAASGRILVLDSSYNFDARFTTRSGSWLTPSELTGDSSRMIVDGFCLISKAPCTSTFYTATPSITGKGAVFFGGDHTTRMATAGSNVFFRTVPASGYKVSSISVNGTPIAVKSATGSCSYNFTMPAGNATINVTFTASGTASAPTALTSAFTYAWGEGIVVRSDGAEPGSYMGLFKADTTTYSKDTAVFYYNAMQYANLVADETTGALMGYTNHLDYSIRGGNYKSYAPGNYKVLVYNTAGQVLSNVINITINSGTTSTHMDTLLFTPSGVKTYSVTPDDIIFDSASAAEWILDSGLNDASAALGTDASGDKCLVVTSEASNDPQLGMNFGKLDAISASTYKYIVVTAKTSAANTNARMYLCAGSITGATEDCAKGWQWKNDGLWHDYLIDLSALTNWTGNINSIRFDFFDGTTEANSILYLRSVKFYSSKPSTPTITTNKTSFAVGESITLNYSGLTSYLDTKQNQLPFIAIYAEGTSPGNGKALLYTYASTASGSATFPAGAAGGTASGTTLPEGNYTAWVAYDAKGSSDTANLNNVHYAADSASYDFVIGSTGTDTPVEPDPVVKGDVDDDGALTIADASMVMAALRGTATLTDTQVSAVTSLSGNISGKLSILDVMALLNSI